MEHDIFCRSDGGEKRDELNFRCKNVVATVIDSRWERIIAEWYLLLMRNLINFEPNEDYFFLRKQ